MVRDGSGDGRLDPNRINGTAVEIAGIVCQRGCDSFWGLFWYTESGSFPRQTVGIALPCAVDTGWQQPSAKGRSQPSLEIEPEIFSMQISSSVGETQPFP